MIYSVADVATKLNLKILATSEGQEWHGANPGGSGATKDGFILYPEGNAYDRKIDTRYKSFEVARLAGIEPAHYEPCIEYSNGNPNGYSNANSNGHANGFSNGLAPTNGSAPKPSASQAAPEAPREYETRSLEERGVSRITLGLFHVTQTTRSNRAYTGFRCYEYPTYFVDGRVGRNRQKVIDPNTTNGDKYFWAGGDKDTMPHGYNLQHVREWVASGHRELWLVESEVSTWLMHQSGVRCVNPFGAGRRLNDLLGVLKEAGVDTLHVCFDCDEAGRKATVKVMDIARDLGLAADVRKLISSPNSGYDVADLYEACVALGDETTGGVERFKLALDNLPRVGARELAAWKKGQDSETFEREQREKDEEKDDPKAAKAERLLAMIDETEGVKLFHTPDDECYCIWPQILGAKQQLTHAVYAIGDSKFHKHLVHRYHQKTKRVLEAAVVDNVVRVLEGRAYESRARDRVWVRTAEKDNRVYIDLCNDAWEVVEISADGWKIIHDPPVYFRRAKGVEELPVPQRGGNWDEVRALMNADEESNWILIVAWLVTALRPPKYPYPILSVHGEQESGKSSLSRMVRKMIDPNFTTLIGTSTRDERDLAIICKNSYVIGFDNLSGVKQWFNDVLCSLVTEGCFRTRKLRSDDEEVLFKAQRPIVLNGINENLGQNDLRRRSLKLWLPPMDKTKKRDEQEVWEDFERVWPRALGLICDAISCALKNLSTVEVPHRRGLIDFMKWVIAAEPVLPWEAGRFAEIYLENQQAVIEAANDNSSFTNAIVEFMNHRDQWRGSPTELLEVLNRTVSEEIQRSRAWPNMPEAVGTTLNRISPNLRAVGVDVARGRSNGKRFLNFRKMSAAEIALNSGEDIPEETPATGGEATANFDHVTMQAAQHAMQLEHDVFDDDD